MKKKLYSSICLLALSVITLCACGKQKQGNPIVLPNKEEIISIGVSEGEKSGFSPNTEGEADAFISEFLGILMDMEVTNKESITDVPSNKDYITIYLNCEDKTTTLFYYKEKDTEYVEQPYQGIYIPAPALNLLITEMLDSTDNEPGSITFQATVIEINNDTILVKPVDGSLELDSSDQFILSNEDHLALQIDDLIEIDYNGEIMESYPAQLGEVYDIAVIKRAEADAMWDRIPMAMVNGKLYYDTGKESTVSGRCGNMDGEITSTVEGSEIPTENNQSNFGTGFGYQYGEDNTIEIYMNEKWFIFEYREEKAVGSISGTITRIGEEKSYDLTEEEVNIITDIIEKGVWSTEGTADCANDCKLIIGERTYDYHSECGTFNDNLNNQNLSVAAKEKKSINAILARYITLGPE